MLEILSDYEKSRFPSGKTKKKHCLRDKKVYETERKVFYEKYQKGGGKAGNAHNYIGCQGDMVFFGDDNWNIFLNMMIGIQMAVSVRGYQEMIY